MFICSMCLSFENSKVLTQSRHVVLFAHTFDMLIGVANAMVTNHLRALYGAFFTQTGTILRLQYGARPAKRTIV